VEVDDGGRPLGAAIEDRYAVKGRGVLGDAHPVAEDNVRPRDATRFLEATDPPARQIDP
jgi:hypothetical protein